jgi:hypothetical protein
MFRSVYSIIKTLDFHFITWEGGREGGEGGEGGQLLFMKSLNAVTSKVIKSCLK